MIFLQIRDPVIDDLDLLFQYGDPLGKIVVLPHLPSQLRDLLVGHCLVLVVGDDDAQQRQSPGDQRHDDALCHILTTPCDSAAAGRL